MHHAWFGPGEDSDVFPLTPVRIYAVASLFKAGRYRTTPNYLCRAKEEHISLGYDWDEHLAMAASKAIASTQRGIGPARQSEPLPSRRSGASRRFGTFGAWWPDGHHAFDQNCTVVPGC